MPHRRHQCATGHIACPHRPYHEVQNAQESSTHVADCSHVVWHLSRSYKSYPYGPGPGFTIIKPNWKHLQTFDKFGDQMNKKQKKIHPYAFLLLLWTTGLQNRLFLQNPEKSINYISYCPNCTFRYTSDATDLGKYGLFSCGLKPAHYCWWVQQWRRPP